MTPNPNNYSNISFPSLKLDFNPGRGISFGENFHIQYYGIIIAIGLLLAVFYGLKRRRQFGLKENDILDGVLCIVPIAVICARLYYCAFSWDEFKANPIRILYIWEGGLAIYGGVIGAAISVVVYCMIRKMKLPAVLDLTALGFLIGQSVGRWGNFFNREAFGEATESFLRMGLLNIYSGKVEYYHPTFLYESLWNLVGFVGLHFLSKKRQYDGQIALGYVAWYGLGRTFIEGIRMDSLYWGNIRVSQMLAAITCFLAVGALFVLAFFRHDRAKLYGVTNAEAIAAEDAQLEENRKKNKARFAKLTSRLTGKAAPVQETAAEETADEEAEVVEEETEATEE